MPYAKIRRGRLHIKVLISNMPINMSLYGMWNLVLDEESASSFLSRSLLYNSWDFELVVPDSLERECKEELCSYEEAREVFEDNTQTVKLLMLMFSQFKHIWKLLVARDNCYLFVFGPSINIYSHVFWFQLNDFIFFFFYFRKFFGPVMSTVKVMVCSPFCNAVFLLLFFSVVLFDRLAGVLICYIFKVYLWFYGFNFNP